MKEIKTKANLKCPVCGFSQEAEMPEDACQFFINVQTAKLC